MKEVYHSYFEPWEVGPRASGHERASSRRYGRGKSKGLWIGITAFLGILTSVSSTFAEDQSTKPYSGNLWSRSTLTGDWGGVRNDLALKGVTFDLNLTQVGQDVAGGGKDSGWQYGGRGNLTLNVDTQKLGLWPGGFFSAEFEGNFGNSVNSQTGALMGVNSNHFYPTPTYDDVGVPEVKFAQFLSEYFGLYFGKIDTTSGDENAFAHGKGDTQFMNLALNFNPVVFLTMPYSTLGAGLIVLPVKNPEAAIVSFGVFSSDGKATTSGFDDLDSDKLTFAGEARVRTDFFGLTGHQLVGGTYSNKDFGTLGQELRFIVVDRTIKEVNGSWSVYYNFDQYLYETKKGSGKGIGIFGRFGASDGDANPVHYFYSLGIGGKGIVPERPLDSFGIGSYYIDVSNPEIQTLVGTRSYLRDEYGFEAYYDAAITPWMYLTPDIQVVRPAQKREVRNRNEIETATVVGLRLRMVF
jgi:porin